MNWIKTKDRMPDDKTWILFHAPGIFTDGPDMWIGEYRDGIFFSKRGFFANDEVTHWMNLPDLPAIEENDEVKILP